ncbi:MAG: hypothetical protein NTU95_11365 [Methanothrix sp.]|nr:hypothetical protein [Methanothrix sp.]
MQKAARVPAAREAAQRLQREVIAALAQAEALKLQARQEDLTVCARATRRATCIWAAAGRRMPRAARQKARWMMVEAHPDAGIGVLR